MSAQKGSSSPFLRPLEGKAAAAWQAEQTKEYVRTTKRQEPRWRHFSTLPHRFHPDPFPVPGSDHCGSAPLRLAISCAIIACQP